jgi:hypothetical protein
MMIKTISSKLRRGVDWGITAPGNFLRTVYSFTVSNSSQSSVSISGA